MGDAARLLVLASPSDIIDGVNAAIFGTVSPNPTHRRHVPARLDVHRRGDRRDARVLSCSSCAAISDHGVTEVPATAPAPAPAPAPTPAPAPAIELDHVSRWYGNVVAVNDISFALGPA